MFSFEHFGTLCRLLGVLQPPWGRAMRGAGTPQNHGGVRSFVDPQQLLGMDVKGG